MPNEVKITFELYEVITAYPIVDIGGIKENIYWQLGLGNTSALGIGLGYSVSYRNTDNRGNFGGTLRLPFIKGKPFGAEVEYSKEASSEPVFFRETSLNYLYDKRNLRLSGLYYLTPRSIFKLTGSYFTEEYRVDGENANGFPSDFLHRKFLFSEELYINKESYFYYLINGYSIFFKLTQVVNLDDEADFNLVSAQAKYYRRFNKRGNLAFRTQIGLATNSDSPFAPFVLDSNINIRGSGNRQERGTASAIINGEFRYSICDRQNIAIQSCVFADSGVWRNPGEELSLNNAKESLRLFTGLGVRFIYKPFSQAIFRIDYGVDTQDRIQRGFVFGIGQYF